MSIGKAWASIALGDLCKMYQPKTITKNQLKADGSFPVFGANGVMGRYDRYNHEEPQLIVGCRGACGSVHITEPRSWITGNSMVIQPDLRQADLQYLRYFFEGPAVLASVITGAAQPQITQTSLRQVQVPLPKLDEQKRIVAVLDRVFAAIDHARAHAEANLRDDDALRQSVLRQVFSGHLGSVSGWRKSSLGEIYDIGSSKRVLQKQWKSSGVPFYRAREIVKLAREGRVDNELFISEEHFVELKKAGGIPQPGDLMVSAVGTLGACYAVQEGDRFYYKDASVLCFKPKAPVEPRFMQYAFLSDELLSRVKSGEGATVGTFTIARARATEFMVPSMEEQKRIVSMLDRVFAAQEHVRAHHKSKLAEIADLRQSLLQQAFSGQLG